jgi:hypothetical protein
MNRPWVLSCVTAEAIGMTAAAGAARGATVFTGHAVGHATTWGLLLVVLGGLVEGGALGVLQARALTDVLGPTGRQRWTAVTILVAGLGWAAASSPAALSGDDGGATPSLLLVLPGAALLGAVMGVALGATQAWALRHRVRHPWRWVAGSAAGWAAAMPVIFLAATGVGATWPWWIVVPIGTVTGLAAGLALGTVSGPFLDTLDGPAWHHRLVLGVLMFRRARAPAVDGRGGLVGLGVDGVRTGRHYRFPVEAACWGPDRLVVLPAHPERKTWWRNLDGRPAVEVLLAGVWVPATGFVVRGDDPGWRDARSAYAVGFPSVRAPGDPLVVLSLAPDHSRREIPVSAADISPAPAVVRSA